MPGCSRLFIALSLVLPGLGCATPEVTLSALADTSWVAVEIGGQAILADAAPMLAFDTNQRVSGNTGLNGFHGSYTTDGRGLHFGPLATTRRAGPPHATKQEAEFLDALEHTRGFSLGSDKLDLLDEEAERLMSLVTSPR